MQDRLFNYLKKGNKNKHKKMINYLLEILKT